MRGPGFAGRARALRLRKPNSEACLSTVSRDLEHDSRSWLARGPIEWRPSLNPAHPRPKSRKHLAQRNITAGLLSERLAFALSGHPYSYTYVCTRLSRATLYKPSRGPMYIIHLFVMYGAFREPSKLNDHRGARVNDRPRLFFCSIPGIRLLHDVTP